MIYRKGELSKAQMDRDWPHQVIVPAEVACRTGRMKEVNQALRNTSVCSRHHGLRRDDRDFLIYCFSSSADADAFAVQFAGERITAKSRRRFDPYDFRDLPK